MNEQSLRLRLGLFMGATLIALAGLVVLFGGAPRVFTTEVKYTLIFPEAPGVGPGTPIRKSGVRIGQVKAVELDPDTGQVRVRIAVEPKYLPRKNEEAHITRGLLSGDTAIDIFPQLGPDNLPLPPGEVWPPESEIAGVPPVTPRSILNPAAAALANAQDSLDRITQTFERFEKTAPKIERAVDEAAELFKDIRDFIPELRKTNQRLQNFIGAEPTPKVGPVIPAGLVGAALQPLEAEDANLRAFVREAQLTLRSIRPTIEEFRMMMQRLEPDITGTVRGARSAFDSINMVLSPENRMQIAELLRNLNVATTNVSKFITSLGGALDQVEKTLKNVDAQVTATGLILGDVRAVTKPLAARSENLVASVVASADELSKLLTEIRAIAGAFAKEDGTIQKLLTDQTMYRNLDDAAASVARIMLRAEKITRDLEVFADKVARRPELIGIGGALRPSSGLKDLPGTPSYRPDWPPSSSAKPQSGPNWLPPPQSSDYPRGGPSEPIQGYKP